MPADRTPGMDHAHYAWSSLPDRPILRWPHGAALTTSFVIPLEHYEINPPEDARQSAWIVGGLGPRPAPNYARLSHREYGHRVGIFRILDALDQHGIVPTVAVDAFTARDYPWLVDHLMERGADIIGHGQAITRIITSDMTIDVERAYIEESLDILSAATGSRPVGWLSPDQSESANTPVLLAEAGIEYVCDWSNDEQPYRMTVPGHDLIALPNALEYDTAFALSTRGMTLDSYEQMVSAGLRQLVDDGQVTARMAVINLYPWLIGQPFRIGTLINILTDASRLSGLKFATTGEAAQWAKTLI